MIADKKKHRIAVLFLIYHFSLSFEEGESKKFAALS